MALTASSSVRPTDLPRCCQRLTLTHFAGAAGADGCGKNENMTLYAELLQASVDPSRGYGGVLIENCHCPSLPLSLSRSASDSASGRGRGSVPVHEDGADGCADAASGLHERPRQCLVPDARLLSVQHLPHQRRHREAATEPDAVASLRVRLISRHDAELGSARRTIRAARCRTLATSSPTPATPLAPGSGTSTILDHTRIQPSRSAGPGAGRRQIISRSGVWSRRWGEGPLQRRRRAARPSRSRALRTQGPSHLRLRRFGKSHRPV